MFGLARELSYKTAEGSRYTRKILLPRCKKGQLRPESESRASRPAEYLFYPADCRLP
jgi:hypothetical protein